MVTLLAAISVEPVTVRVLRPVSEPLARTALPSMVRFWMPLKESVCPFDVTELLDTVTLPVEPVSIVKELLPDPSITIVGNAIPVTVIASPPPVRCSTWLAMPLNANVPAE